ncbi:MULTISPECIES: type I restriction enzyme endonuclease domain-containing protein [Bacillus]|uniref:type I restriction enzyme endonuclease domain-containing protein n=1 Tax=Bacillus TaxID=1386 RepID=UPI001CEF7201|nr:MULTISPECIES: type I restriction enzyme endonuclease domain-containing protein [Bacillus cereus group]MDX6047600.1 DUF3387 domain-containing protein [Bacillus paranthracis]
MGDDTLKLVVHELTKSIKENMSIDWHLRESVSALIRITVKRLIKKYGYPPEISKEAIETVTERTGWMSEQLALGL